MERITFFVDGFNFYHGLKRMRAKNPDWQQFYWIDIVKFFEYFVSPQHNQHLQKVYYFTAPDHDPIRLLRQKALLSANELLNGSRFEVVNGLFYKKTVKCKTCFNIFQTWEEKRTDVNIAIKMLDECTLDNVDTLVMVSADSDLISPLQLINERHPSKKIRVYFPPGNRSDALYNYMKTNNNTVISLKNSKRRFENSLMPHVVTKDGISYAIPPKWKTYVPSQQNAHTPLPIDANSICPHCKKPIINS